MITKVLNGVIYIDVSSEPVLTIEEIESSMPQFINPKSIIWDYECGGYEGWGDMIIEDTAGRWYYYSLGHCSCYGPLDNLIYLHADQAYYTDLEKLKSSLSDELQNQMGKILNA